MSFQFGLYQASCDATNLITDYALNKCVSLPSTANYANPSTVAKDTNVIMCTYSDKDCKTLSGGVGYMTCSGSCNTKNCLKNPAGAQSYIFKEMPAVVTENPCLAGASSGGTGSSASPSPKASTGSSSSSTSGAKELKVSHVLLVALIAVSLIQMV